MVNITKVSFEERSNCKKTALNAVLTVAGSDSSGGAGIEADLKTLTAHRVFGLTCITALTAQNTQKVYSFVKTSEQKIKEILDANIIDFVEGYKEDEQPLKVVKTGMLSKEAVLVLDEYWHRFSEKNIKLVMDPVIVSTSGTELCDKEGVEAFSKHLIKKAFLITPNFTEAMVLKKNLTGEDKAAGEFKSLDDYIGFVVQLQKELGCASILVKGGHIPWNSSSDRPLAKGESPDQTKCVIIDILYEGQNESVTVFESPYISSKDTHGTGCTLSSAIAANLANGRSLSKATQLAIDYTQRGMISLKKKLGHGNGPLNHAISPQESLKSETHKTSGKSTQETILEEYGSVLEYFKSHPKVEPKWQEYTHHKFVGLLAKNELPFDEFLYFLKQDFYYLINYAQVHGLLVSVTDDYKQIRMQSAIIQEIVTEIEKHKEKLSKAYNIDYCDTKNDIQLHPNNACIEYCNYILEKGRSEDFLGIKVALAPCLHGYAEAAKWGKTVRESAQVPEDNETSKTYHAWLDDYTSDWYREADKRGQEALQDIFKSSNLSDDRVEELASIFADVTQLEVNFWNEVLNI
ncbi:Piso0_001752 [Millerozyma farinosa CBS 7064]|uniref:Piso0_001752 protein n=1 Tax=Pichia sorbitophila (strain ATCC MYA-4447 / BCRC 22081 / CBS 7064 / NBRC 10061 / NRRL Y-12695) TaxID=559304 RepID=G8YLM4_PICSO|nr:Piso0_001752 [Millerozyma farinosa CBS 7064]